VHNYVTLSTVKPLNRNLSTLLVAFMGAINLVLIKLQSQHRDFQAGLTHFAVYLSVLTKKHKRTMDITVLVETVRTNCEDFVH